MQQRAGGELYGLQLPSINTVTASLRLLWGSLFRHVALTCLYHGARSVFGTSVRGDKTSARRNKMLAKRYIISTCVEVGISIVFVPTRYLAAANTQRFLFDFLLPDTSEALSLVDGFRAGEYLSLANLAFTPDITTEWNLDFFVWQLPGVALTMAKLMARRRRLGAARCRVKRVIGVALVHMMVRAFVASFSVQLPQTEGDAIVALAFVGVESLCAKYLIRHTWPVAFELDGDAIEPVVIAEKTA